MKPRLWVLGLGMVTAAAMAAEIPGLPRTAAPAHARVRILSPANGAVVGQDVTVKFGVKGVQVQPAGDMHEHGGHFHLYVDADNLPSDGQFLPKDAHHLHFGMAQTQTTLHLTPGKHTLQLELGDSNHLSFQPRLLSPKVTIQVR